MCDALYLSPHFDDVVLSCGAQVWDRVRRGQHVAVVTVCAAPPPAPHALSPFAAGLHTRWAQAGQFDREAEDDDALMMLGAVPLRLIYQDCIYRQNTQGIWLYDSEAAIFGSVSSEETPLVRELAHVFASLDLAPEAPLFAPRAIGNHVDHQWIQQAAEAWGKKHNRPVQYYADYPYAESEPGGEPVTVSAAGRERKVKALAAYRSQISSFWPDLETMAARVAAWEERVF